MTEAWVEVNITPRREVDSRLLLEGVAPLIHEQLSGEIESWHYFWEPALRLRLRWRDPARRGELEDRFRSQLEEWRAAGLIDAWAEGNHGEEGRYAGEAAEYGIEAWDLIQKDWMNGSELAVRLIRLEQEDRLTGTLARSLEEHWSRHVHLFTNQLFGWFENTMWLKEVDLCQRQAQGYLRTTLDVLSNAAAPPAS